MPDTSATPVTLNQLLRYEPIVRLVETVPGGRVLDVGSGSWGIGRWLGSPWKVVALDRSFDDYGGARGPVRRGTMPVLGDAAALPFRERSFDVVVALDLLEHVPPDTRSRGIDELCRVTKRRLILACPTGRNAYEADRRLHDFYERRGGGVVRWLVEHVEYGLPSASAMAGALRPYGSVRTFENENVHAHQRVMLADAYPILREIGFVVARLLSRAARAGARPGASSWILRLIRGRDRTPAYRTIHVLDREDRRESGQAVEAP